MFETRGTVGGRRPTSWIRGILLATVVLAEPAVAQNFSVDVCNTGSRLLEVAGVYAHRGQYVLQGWSPIEPGQCRTMVDEPGRLRNYMAFAVNLDAVRVRLPGSPAGNRSLRRTDRSFCVHPTEQFRMVARDLDDHTDCREGFERIRFDVEAVWRERLRRRVTYQIDTDQDDLRLFPSQLHRLGQARERDAEYREAFRSYQIAAVNDAYVPAQYALARMYERGLGVEQDHTEALRWYRSAAELGDARAQTAVGFFHYTGRGVPVDYAAAARWYRRAAEQGNAMAMSNLAHMYRHGNGVPLNPSEALRWYLAAAEQDHAGAHHALGHMYEQGEGTPVDVRRALHHYRAAAEGGIDEAPSDTIRLKGAGR